MVTLNIDKYVRFFGHVDGHVALVSHVVTYIKGSLSESETCSSGVPVKVAKTE